MARAFLLIMFSLVQFVYDLVYRVWRGGKH